MALERKANLDDMTRALDSKAALDIVQAALAVRPEKQSARRGQRAASGCEQRAYAGPRWPNATVHGRREVGPADSGKGRPSSSSRVGRMRALLRSQVAEMVAARIDELSTRVAGDLKQVSTSLQKVGFPPSPPPLPPSLPHLPGTCTALG